MLTQYLFTCATMCFKSTKVIVRNQNKQDISFPVILLIHLIKKGHKVYDFDKSYTV